MHKDNTYIVFLEGDINPKILEAASYERKGDEVEFYDKDKNLISVFRKWTGIHLARDEDLEFDGPEVSGTLN